MPAIPNEATGYLNLILEGRYRLVAYIGEGHFTFCFEAEDQTDGARVAVKVLKISQVSPSTTLELQTERELLRRLASADCVVNCFPGDVAVVPLQLGGAQAISFPLPYAALELADGTLADLIADRHKLPWRERLTLLRQVAKGLHQMHLAQIFHRDVKSENVLVFVERDVVAARIADLGRSADLNSPRRVSLQDYTISRGDLRFAPPELVFALGVPDDLCWRRADYYLLGSVFFELATGQPLTSLLSIDPVGIAASLIGTARSDRVREFESALGSLEAEFLRLWELFEAELPPALRAEGRRLIQMLTDPRPERRGLLRFGRPVLDDLWILRKIDMLLILLRNAERDRRTLDRKKRLRGRST